MHNAKGWKGRPSSKRNLRCAVCHYSFETRQCAPWPSKLSQQRECGAALTAAVLLQHECCVSIQAPCATPQTPQLEQPRARTDSAK
eukprot:4217477-Pleurochrysis_carterae.AAC.1